MAILKFPSDNRNISPKPRVTFRSYKWNISKPSIDNFKSESILDNQEEQDITLYMPNNFSEDYTADWSSEDVFTAGIDFTRGMGANIGEFLRQTTDAMSIQGIGNTVRYGTGLTNYPGKFLIFNKANPVTLQFAVELVPHSQDEAIEIDNICSVFKSELLPEFNGYFLEFPNIWRINFKNIIGPGFNVENHFGEYQGMALTGCKVTYNGGAQTALTYSDDYPIAVTLALTFTSIKHLYKDRGLNTSVDSVTTSLVNSKGGIAFKQGIEKGLETIKEVAY